MLRRAAATVAVLALAVSAAAQDASASQTADAAQPFPEHLVEERRALLAAGFGSWTREDLDHFVRACG